MNKTKPAVFGVSYYPDHWPETEWERDMQRIRDSGLGMIRFGEFSWNWYEPHEGEFDFGPFDRFMELARQIGLKVILCTPTAAPPEWFLYRYPETRLLDQHGVPHPGGRHMVCYNHPRARELAERAITALATRYKNHPALFGWQIDNEPTAGESSSPDRMYDYHPETARKFTAYLHEKYGDLGRLNQEWQNSFWGRGYSAWEEIAPPLSPRDRPGLWLEWMRFRDRNVCDLIRWQRDLLKRIDPSSFIGTNIPECGTMESIWLGQDYWRQCEGLDYVGTDLYWYDRDIEKSLRAIDFSCDIIRSAAVHSGAEFWVSETQAGPHRLPWRMTFAGGLWGPEFLRLCTEEYRRHGAQKILYFLWRPTVGGQEFGMNGLVGFDGEPNEITRHLPGILAQTSLKTDAFTEKLIVYFHYSRDSLLLCSGYDPDATAVSSLCGWYALFADLGYRVEFLSDEGVTRKEWTGGELCIFPYSMVVSSTLAASIREMARRKCRLVGGFATGFFNEYGAIAPRCPRGGLEEIFGARVRGFDWKTASGIDPAKIGGMRASPILYAQYEQKGGKLQAFDIESQHAAVVNENAVYLPFDLGTLYGSVPADDKGRARAAIKLLIQSFSPSTATLQQADIPPEDTPY